MSSIFHIVKVRSLSYSTVRGSMKLLSIPIFRKPVLHTTFHLTIFLALCLPSFFIFMASVMAATPVISGIATGNLLTNSATISWTTDVPSDTQIEYGTTTAYGSSTTLNSALVTSHTQTIGGLQTNQLYNYRVKSRDAGGDLAMSANRTFITPLGTTTPGGSTDSSNRNTMNTTRFTTVNGGKVASLSVHVGPVDPSASNRNFQMAIYTANGSVPGTLIASTASGTLTANVWNTLPITATLAPNTNYFIAYNTNASSDSYNNMHYTTTSGAVSGWNPAVQTFGTWPTSFGGFTSWNNVTLSMYASFVSDATPPTVTIVTPTDLETVNGTVAVTADATDDNAVAQVQFKLGANNLGAPDTTVPYGISWNTTDLFDGSQTLTAVATDISGNTMTSAPVTVTTNNPPKMVLTQPTAGQNVEATTVTATYNRIGDWTNGKHVHFRLDGGTTRMDLNADGNQSYAFSDVTGGSHTLEYVVADGSHEEIAGSGGTVSFTTTAPDVTPPTVSVTAPADSAIVQNTITVTADAADETAVLGVQFLLDGTALGAEDTTAPYSVSWNTTTVSNGTHTLTARARDTLNQTTSTAVTVNVQNTDPRAVLGEWGSLMNWNSFVAVHATLFHTGEILMWDAWDTGITDARLWNPTTNVWTNVPLAIPSSELFCAGQATGATGDLVVMGGHSDSGSLGTKTIYMFNPVSKVWNRKVDMGFARWYPSVTQMADNRMVTFSGQSVSGTWVQKPEIFNPTTNTVTQLPFNTPELEEIQYPQTTLLPSGKIMSVSTENGGVMLYDPANSSWNRVGTTERPYGVWTSFEPGKYLITGGSNVFNIPDSPNTIPSQPTTRILDMTSGTPVWSNGGTMNHGRSYHNVTMLPTGKALAVGGASVVSDFARADQSTVTAEMWDPATTSWTEMAAPARPRMYHSISMLLPDGRVLSAGGGRLSPATDQENAQIYSPPYMFQGPRPTITSAPTTIGHNSTMDLVTPNVANISKVTMSSLASVTHTTDWNQHFVELSFTRDGDTLTINTPANTAIAPENYYMIFIVDANGVPSVAKIVKLGAPDTTGPVIGSVQSNSIGGTTATVSWNTDEAADTQIEYGTTTAYGSSTTLDPTLVTVHSQNLTGLTPGTLYHYRVKSRDGAGNLATSTDFTFTTTALDTQAPVVSLTAPADSSTVSATVNVTANASDNIGIAGVQFKLDGANLSTEDTSSPYSVSWNTTSVSNGSHVLTAVARDAAGNTTTASTVTVTVSNSGIGVGLVAAYNFNEGTGTSVNDLSGNGNLGSISQATWYTTGKYGKALSFNGTSAYVSVPDSNSLDLTNKMTLEAWVRPTSSSGWRTVMMKENGNELAYGMYARGSSDRPSGWIRTPSSSSSKSVVGPAKLTLNTWTHLAMTYDGTNMRLYTNGSLVKTQAATGNIYNSSNPLKFGGNAMWNEYFAGQLDEIRIYNRVLNTSEIQTDMNTAL